MYNMYNKHCSTSPHFFIGCTAVRIKKTPQKQQTYINVVQIYICSWSVKNMNESGQSIKKTTPANIFLSQFCRVGKVYICGMFTGYQWCFLYSLPVSFAPRQEVKWNLFYMTCQKCIVVYILILGITFTSCPQLEPGL